MSLRSRFRKPADTPHSTMPEAEEDKPQWSLPAFKDVRQMGWTDIHKEQLERQNDATREFTDVKFYPYSASGHDPIFAVVNARNILICQPSTGKGKGFEVLSKIIFDTDPQCKMYCCAWTKDAVTGLPLLVAAGENATIRIYDVLRGNLARTIIGPGGRINDLAICPTDFTILASASADDRVCIWNLNPAWAHQPCMFILAGIGGHRESLLSVSFHDNGRYLVSGAEDKMVKVWYLPQFSDMQPGMTEVIPYPCFSTSAIHSGHVECVKFCGDLILSKAFEEDCIVLWMMEDFSSSSPPPQSKAHTSEKTLSTTFSDFSSDLKFHPDGTPSFGAQFTRLLQFHTPDCNHLYMRFGLHSGSVEFSHKILSFCNSKSRIFFWDLARFDAYAEYINAVLPPSPSDDIMDLDNDEPPTNSKPKPSWLPITRAPKNKPPSLLPQLQSLSTSLPPTRDSSPSSMHTGSSNTDQALLDARTIFTKEELTRSKPGWDAMYDIVEPWRKLKAHRTVLVPNYDFTGRQVAWDSTGKWCVTAGSENIVVVLER